MIFLDLAYIFFLILVSPAILYRMARYGKYREGLSEKFLGRAPSLPPSSRKRVWLHAVSVGEVNLLKPILAQLRQDRPDWEFVVSATSKTGHALAKKLFQNQPGSVGTVDKADGGNNVAAVFYCPLDFSWAVNSAISRIKPDMLVLIELELWPNLVRAAFRRGVKVAIANGRISDGSYRSYRWIRRFLRGTFSSLDLVAASDELNAGYFRELGADPAKMVVTGSIKFDGVRTERNNPKTVELANLAGIQLGFGQAKEQDTVFLAGSTQDPEEEMALNTFRGLSGEYPNLKLILVPRHPERFDAVARMLEGSGLPWTRRSNLYATGKAEARDSQETGKRANPTEAERAEAERTKTERILLIDTIGELGAWWGTAAIAFVGGSMGKRGGQNMLEPAGYGAAVCFGPNTKNFRDISERMLRADAAEVVHDETEMTGFVRRALADPAWRGEIGGRARQLVLDQRGACRKTAELLEWLLD